MKLNEEKWSIESIHRGYIVYKENNHIAYVPGEMLIGGYQQPDYVIYASNPLKWEPPFENEVINEETHDKIIDRVIDYLKIKNIKIEVDCAPSMYLKW